MPKDKHTISRRDFLRYSYLIGSMLAFKGIIPAYAFHNTGLRAGGRSLKQAKEFDLTIRKETLSLGERQAAAITINGSMPGPLLRFREGEDVIIRVKNTLHEDTSIHWHGLLVPPGMDGVPGVSFAGIRPGETFTYAFPVRQSGTYWYHSHSGLQEQLGHYGPLIIDPGEPEPFAYDREYVVLLSDWTFENPHKILAKLKKEGGYYNFQKQTVPDLFSNSSGAGFGENLKNRMAWARMRMDPTDIADVTGYTYTYLMNGVPPELNWTALFRPGERVRLRFINAGAATYFDVRIPGLALTVIQADGQNIKPVTVDEFRIAIAETYDVIVQPTEDRAYTIFAEAMDRSGFASGTLATREGMVAPIPKRRKRAIRTMADMGMAHDMSGMQQEAGGMQHSQMSGMDMGTSKSSQADTIMTGHDMSKMDMASMTSATALFPPGTVPPPATHGSDRHGPGNSSVPMMTQSRLDEPGIGLGNDGRRVLLYTDLQSLQQHYDFRAPEREIELHLTGNMERYMWSFDGKKFSEVKEPIQFRYGERLRLILVNDTMMEHPIHLHGMWMELENGSGASIPRKHTVNVKPAERLSVLITADAPGRWAFHCHILYHMEMGMFRIVEVTKGDMEEEG
jgi:CopA family copper-resistance protein